MPLRSGKSQRAMVALIGTGAVAGILLASGALAPVVADVVTLTSHDAPAQEQSNGTTVNGKHVALTDSVTGTFDSNDPWMDTADNRPEWSASRGVPQGPTGEDAAQKPTQPQTPDVQVPENPKGRQFFNQPPPVRQYKLQPRGACPQDYSKGLYVEHLSAVQAGSTSATISWYDLGDPNSTTYQIDAVPVTGHGKQLSMTIAAPKACKDVSTTFSGLDAKNGYVFMMTATDVAPEQENRLYEVGRGQTPVLQLT